MHAFEELSEQTVDLFSIRANNFFSFLRNRQQKPAVWQKFCELLTAVFVEEEYFKPVLLSVEKQKDQSVDRVEAHFLPGILAAIFFRPSS